MMSRRIDGYLGAEGYRGLASISVSRLGDAEIAGRLKKFAGREFVQRTRAGWIWWDVTTVHFSTHAARVLRVQDILLCMGLFSRFL
jgi:hypothetical protein